VISLEGTCTDSVESGGCAPPIASAAVDGPAASDTHTVNGLIVGLLDNIDEHRRAIFAVEQRLNRMQRQLYVRVQAVEQLQAYVRALGAQPATMRSTLGAAFAARLACQPRLASNERELMQDAERGELTLRRQMENCLSKGQLSESGRRCVVEVLKEIDSDVNKTSGKTTSGWDPQQILAANTLHSII